MWKLQPEHRTPSWFKLALIAFIAYAFFNYYAKQDDPAAPGQNARPLSPISKQDVTGFVRKVFPAMPDTTETEELVQGEGEPAACGDTAKLRYEIISAEGKRLGGNRTETAPLTFRIGAGAVPPALDKGVLGQKAGGRRLVLTTADQAAKAPEFPPIDAPPASPVKVEMELLGLQPPVDAAGLKLRVFDIQQGLGFGAECSERVRVDVVLWKADGSQLFSTGETPLEFTIGAGEVPVGLERAVIGLQEGGARTVILPPAYQKSLASGRRNANTLPLPGQHVVIMDVKLAGILRQAAEATAKPDTEVLSGQKDGMGE